LSLVVLPPQRSQTSSAWSQSTVLDTLNVAGQARNKNCRPTAGRDEICNGSYGNNGWLGVATIWLQSGSSHIVQGTVKVNDYYLGPGASYAYNNTYEREHVMCQEVGHTFGLDHQDTSGASFGTCMDYYHSTNSTSTTPNAGDYDELLCIYDPANAGRTLTSGSGGTAHTCTGTGHLDSSTTIGASGRKWCGGRSALVGESFRVRLRSAPRKRADAGDVHHLGVPAGFLGALEAQRANQK